MDRTTFAMRVMVTGFVFATLLIISLLIANDLVYLCCYDEITKKFSNGIVGVVKTSTMTFAILAAISTYILWPTVKRELCPED